LIGPWAPWLSDVVAPFASAACTPLVQPSPGTPAPYVFAAGPTPDQVTAAMLHALAHKKVGVLALDNLSTPDSALASSLGVTLTGVEKIPVRATDLTTALKTLAGPKPDALALLVPPPFDAYALRDAKAAGWTGPVLLPPTAANPGVAGPTAEGARMVAPWLAAPASAPPDAPETTTLHRFVSGFEPSHGSVGTQIGSGADAVTLLHLAFLGHRDRSMARDQLAQMCCIGVCGVYEHGRLRDDALVPMTMAGGVWTVDKRP